MMETTSEADAFKCRVRLARIEKAIEDQKVFLHRVPDPDTRYRAEGNLIRLVEMSEAMREANAQLDAP